MVSLCRPKSALLVQHVYLSLIALRTYCLIANHADDLQKVYRKVVLLCEVATLARDLQQNPSFRRRPTSIFGMNEDEFDGMLRRTTETNDLTEQINNDKGMLEITQSSSDTYQGNLNESERRSMLEMLGAWYGTIVSVYLKRIRSLIIVVRYPQGGA
jgi:hypothetical protein